MITGDVPTVDVELTIKSSCMFIVDFLTPLFGLVVVVGGREVIRGFWVVA